MKIAIYGDSYATNIFRPFINDDVSYIEMLYRNHSLTSFAQGGSSLFFSYQNFINNHNKFEKNIFLVTGPGRVLLNKFEHSTLRPEHIHVTGVDEAEKYIEFYKFQEPSKHNVEVFNAVRNYFIYIRNYQQEIVFHNLMLQDIKLKRPDTIIIDTHEFGANKDTDFQFWGIENKIDVYVNYTDVRHCHLSKEKHIILYEMIEDAINTDSNIIDYSRLLNVKPSKTFEQYFKSLKLNIQHISTNDYHEVFK